MELSKKRKSDEITTTAAAAAVNSVSPAVIRAVLEPLSKDQLIDLLAGAAASTAAALAAVRSATDADAARRKLFVRGLGPDTTSETLTLAFSLFGEIEEAVAVSDKATGRPRGFGFVVFRHVDGALTALENPSKKIDGRMTVAQLASAGNSSADVASRKVYVGNIPSDVTADRLLAHFMSYGDIEEGPLGFDNQMGKPKRFAFFIYKSEEGARASLVDPIKTIDGTQVVCKLAVDGKKGKPNGPNEGDFVNNGPNMMQNSNVPGFMNPGPGHGGMGQQRPLMSAVMMVPDGPGYHSVPFYEHGYARGGSRSIPNEYSGHSGTMFMAPPSGYMEGGSYGQGYPTQMNQPPPSGPRGPPHPYTPGMPPFF